jgi:NitT/TauT family transport system substrate-binding protein
MSDALIAYGISSMKAHGILDSGDALKMGIGAMTAERWAAFYQAASDAGIYPKGLDVTKAYTLQFVDQKVGMDLKH